MTRTGQGAYDVEVIRSRKRKKTSEARMVGPNRLQVRIPAWMSKAQEDETVAGFVERFTRQAATDNEELAKRAERLAERYDLPLPRSIRWVSNQRWRWGSCQRLDGSIRLSDRMAGFPQWVIDYVIIHELAHLLVGDHGPDFWALVERYPRTERARGFLHGFVWNHDTDGNDELDLTDDDGRSSATETRPVGPQQSLPFR